MEFKPVGDICELWASLWKSDLCSFIGDFQFFIFTQEVIEFQEKIFPIFYPDGKGLIAIVLVSWVQKTERCVSIENAYIDLINF